MASNPHRGGSFYGGAAPYRSRYNFEIGSDFFLGSSGFLNLLFLLRIQLSVLVYDCSDGLSTRTGAGSEEIQLRIDPMHSDLDDEITGLHGQVRQLKNVSLCIW